MWVSDYPGLEPYLAMFPYTTYAVQQASWVVSLPSAGCAHINPWHELRELTPVVELWIVICPRESVSGAITAVFVQPWFSSIRALSVRL